MTMEQQLLTAVSSVGFPIVITFFLLIRLQKTLDKFTDTLTELVHELKREAK